jgi:hypothetical protein
MQSDLSKKYVIVETEKNKHKLQASEYARWLCLIEALDIISRKATQFKMDLHGKDVDWVKPLAFQKYIVDRYESMIDEVSSNEGVKLTLKKPKCTTLLEPKLP